MSRKPVRIVRTPQGHPSGPPRSRLAPSTTPPAASICRVCAAFVADAELHAAYHDRTDRWAQRVGEVLQIVLNTLLVRRGAITNGKPGDHP